MDIHPGLSAVVELTVTDSDTSEHLGSGDVPVLATPRIVLLAEQATRAALAGHVDGEFTAVGHRVQFDHLAPVPVGRTVRAEATLEAVDGRRLVFKVAVSDDRGLVGAGRLTRVLVTREGFLDRASGVD